MRIPFPRLLGKDLKNAGFVKPQKLSINFNARSTSTAALVLPKADQKIRMHAFIELYTEKGFSGIFRVTGETETLERDRQFNLKHAIDTLHDSQFTSSEDFTGTPEAFFTKLLGHQKNVYWQLGTCEDTETYTKSGINSAFLSDLVSEYLTNRDRYMLTYTFDTFPWTVNIVKMPEEIGAEFRLRRNLQNNVRILRDDQNQCTRLNVSVLSTASSAVEKKVFDDEEAQEVYGVIEKSAEIYKESVPDAEAWAKDYFKKYAHPYISISAPAFELYAQTGVEWDEFSAGKLARVALPDYGETYVERINSVSYADVYGQPKNVTVQLANPLKTLSETMRDIKDLAYANASSISNTQKEVNHWEMIVTEIKYAQDKTGITDLWQSGIVLDAKEGVKVFSLYEGFAALKSWVDINAEEISLRVMKNGVIAAINLTSEEARISANKIVLDGYVTASEFNATLAEFLYNNSVMIETNQLNATNASISTLSASGFTLAENRVQILPLTMGEVETDAKVLTTSGGGINLQHSHSVSIGSDGKVTLGEVSATGGNFNVADTTFYKDAVSAAYNRGYAAGSAAGAGSYNEGYTAGYEEGWVAAAAMATTSRSGQKITVRRPSSIVDTPADDMVYTISPGGSINSITNTAANVFFAQGVCKAFVSVNGGTAIQVASVTKTKTQTINVGQ